MQIPSYTLLLFIDMPFALKKLDEGNSRYAFKQYTTMMLQLYMLL